MNLLKVKIAFSLTASFIILHTFLKLEATQNKASKALFLQALEETSLKYNNYAATNGKLAHPPWDSNNNKGSKHTRIIRLYR